MGQGNTLIDNSELSYIEYVIKSKRLFGYFDNNGNSYANKFEKKIKKIISL